MMRLKNRPRPGQVLVFTMVILGFLLVVVTVAFNLVGYEQQGTSRSYQSKQALSLAEAGVDWAIRQLNANSNYPGESNVVFGNGTFTIAVSGVDSSRTIEVTGSIPNSINPVAERKVRVDALLSGDNVEFFYGLQVDGGGLQMSNNSHVVGNVYSNGNIIGGAGTTISGDAIVAGGLAADPDVSWTTTTASQSFATTNNNRSIAQSFTANKSDNLNKISVPLSRVGSPTSNLAVHIAADNAGQPSTVSLSDSAIAVASVGLTSAWVDASFASPAALSVNTKYWIVLEYGSGSNTNYWQWQSDPTDGYLNNTAKYTNNCCGGNPTWTALNSDLDFKVWLGGFQTRIEGVTVGSSTSGTARANVFANTSVHGSNCPNSYCVIDNPPAEVMPIPDGIVQDWKNAAAAGGSQGSYSLTSGAGAIGPVKINGDLTIGIGATLTINGTLWVTGNIDLSNNCVIQLNSGYGNTSGIIITDGTVNISNNCEFLGSGTGSHVLLLTTRDAPNETSMTISNNSAGVYYYAAKSFINFSNNAQAQEATAWGISLSNGATITYVSGLANLFFSSGPGGGWRVQTGTWRELSQ